MQNVIIRYHGVQELCTFSQTSNERTDSHSGRFTQVLKILYSRISYIRRCFNYREVDIKTNNHRMIIISVFFSFKQIKFYRHLSK